MQSAAGASTLQGFSSRELVRRWNGLGHKQWSIQEDLDVFSHLESASLQTLDELSAPILKVAQHIEAMSRHVEVQKQVDVFMLLRSLCPALACGLQQLGVGLRLYLDSGQLPAALTARALDGIITLCLLANKMYAYTEDVQAANSDYEVFVLGMRAKMVECVLDTGTGCRYCCTAWTLAGDALQPAARSYISISRSGMHHVSLHLHDVATIAALRTSRACRVFPRAAGVKRTASGRSHSVGCEYTTAIAAAGAMVWCL
jgi:hypothetical protein